MKTIQDTIIGETVESIENQLFKDPNQDINVTHMDGFTAVHSVFAHNKSGAIYARTKAGNVMAEVRYSFASFGDGTTFDLELRFGTFQLNWRSLVLEDLESYDSFRKILQEVLTIGQLQPVRVTNTHRVYHYDRAKKCLFFNQSECPTVEVFLNTFVRINPEPKPASADSNPESGTASDSGEDDKQP